jgi:hypothetical protein
MSQEKYILCEINFKKQVMSFTHKIDGVPQLLQFNQFLEQSGDKASFWKRVVIGFLTINQVNQHG